MTETLTINYIVFGTPLTASIPVNIYYQEKFASSFTLLASNVMASPQTGKSPYNGYLQGSPAVQLTVTANVDYIIQAQNAQCQVIYQETFSYPCSGNCPPGFSLDPTQSFCQSIQVMVATPPTNPQDAVAVSDTSYNTCGTWIFDPGYNFNGTGTATQIPLSNPFWVNGAGVCVPQSGTTTDGRINQIAIWITPPLPGQTIGYSYCFDLDTSTTVYIGFAADNYGTLQIDGANVIVQDPVAMDAQFGTTLGQSAFQVYCIYPVTLTEGQHIVGMIGTNAPSSIPGPNPGMIASEIYQNTSAEISAATSTSDLSILFSTESRVGLPIEVGNDGNGFTCPSGWTLNSCTSPFVCQRTVTASVIC